MFNIKLKKHSVCYAKTTSSSRPLHQVQRKYIFDYVKCNASNNMIDYALANFLIYFVY